MLRGRVLHFCNVITGCYPRLKKELKSGVKAGLINCISMYLFCSFLFDITMKKAIEVRNILMCKCEIHCINFSRDLSIMKKFLILLFFGICLGVVLSLVGAEMIERTSGVEFCSKCHSMEGMAESYKVSMHGGNNRIGIKAKCADCHLPHDDVFTYVTAKAYTGIRDVLGELFWVDDIDWIANLERRKEYTYSNGCQKCHNLDVVKYEIPKAYLAHRDFKTGKVDSCVQCHEHVGHKNIKAHL